MEYYNLDISGKPTTFVSALGRLGTDCAWNRWKSHWHRNMQARREKKDGVPIASASTDRSAAINRLDEESSPPESGTGQAASTLAKEQKAKKAAEKEAAFLKKIEAERLNEGIVEENHQLVEEADIHVTNEPFQETSEPCPAATNDQPTATSSTTNATKAKGLASIPLENIQDYLVFGFLVYVRLQICSDLNITAFYKGLSKVLKGNAISNETLDTINQEVTYIRNHLYSTSTVTVPLDDTSSPLISAGAKVLANYPLVSFSDYVAFGEFISKRMQDASADKIVAFYRGLSKVLYSERMTLRVFDTITQRIASLRSPKGKQVESVQNQRNATDKKKVEKVTGKLRHVFGEAENFAYDEKDDHLEKLYSHR